MKTLLVIAGLLALVVLGYVIDEWEERDRQKRRHGRVVRKWSRIP